MAKHPTIRDALEQDAWSNHPGFAQRLTARRQGRVRRKLCWQDRALLVLASVLVLLLIVRIESARADSGAADFWGLEETRPGGVRSLALDTDMQIDVTGLAARVAVSQRFRNDGLEWREAVYRFPLPEGAAVDRLRIEAGARVIEGEIREKVAARRQYQQALDAGRLATLVEQERPNQFETRLANIGPGEEIRVEIAFLAAVEYRDGVFSLRLPMTFTPRWEPAGERGAEGSPFDGAPQPLLTRSEATGGQHLNVELTLNAGTPLSGIVSRHHDIDVQPVPGGYRIRLADPDARPDRLFELDWTPDFGADPSAAASAWDAGDAVYALLMLTPPLAAALEPTPREVVFVIDTSGSMEGASLREAQAALRQGLDFLDPEDRFNLVRFDADADLLFEDSLPPDPAYITEAVDYIDGLQASGGTDMGPALRLAMNLPEHPGLLRQIVFITDGSVGNEGDLLLRIGEDLGDSRLFTVAIGSAPNTWFMRKAAEIGRGACTLIGRESDVGERMAALWARIETPAVQGLGVDWGMEAEYYPEVIPDLYAGEPLWLRARLPFEPRQVMLRGELDGREWQTSIEVAPLAGGESLATLWARSKIEALEDSRIFGVDPESVRREVVGLALEFGLLTPYTSLVATERTPVRPAAEALATEQVPSLLPAGTTFAAGFSQTATGWPARLALGLLSLFLATGMLLYVPPSREGLAGGARRPGAACRR